MDNLNNAKLEKIKKSLEEIIIETPMEYLEENTASPQILKEKKQLLKANEGVND